MRLWVPAYYYPIGPGLRDWERLMASARSVPIVAIVNPASGPGERVNTNFAAVLPRTTLGRDHAGRLYRHPIHPQAHGPGQSGGQYVFAVLSRISRGFISTNRSSDASGVDYYAELYRYVREPHPRRARREQPRHRRASRATPHARPADVICLFEQRAWFRQVPAPRLGHAISRLAVLHSIAQRCDRGSR